MNVIIHVYYVMVPMNLIVYLVHMVVQHQICVLVKVDLKLLTINVFLKTVHKVIFLINNYFDALIYAL